MYVSRLRLYDAPMTIPYLANFTDEALLLLRIMIGLIFFTSGWKHATSPETRSKDIEMSKGFTRFLGIVECAGALGVAFGVLTQFAAIGLMLVMFGAMQKKILKWHTGFWGKHGTDGWSYEIMIILMNLVIATTAGGRFVLEELFRFSIPRA
jgi:putative oxidoreductase